MPTSEKQRRQWADAETGRMVEELGLSIQDAQRIVNDVLMLVPPGEDPATYEIPALQAMAGAEVTDADIEDARADWYADDDVPAEDKRLLDAMTEAE